MTHEARVHRDALMLQRVQAQMPDAKINWHGVSLTIADAQALDRRDAEQKSQVQDMQEK